MPLALYSIPDPTGQSCCEPDNLERGLDVYLDAAKSLLPEITSALDKELWDRWPGEYRDPEPPLYPTTATTRGRLLYDDDGNIVGATGKLAVLIARREARVALFRPDDAEVTQADQISELPMADDPNGAGSGGLDADGKGRGRCGGRRAGTVRHNQRRAA